MAWDGWRAWNVITVPGATGFLDTDYAAKAPLWDRGAQAA